MTGGGEHELNLVARNTATLVVLRLVGRFCTFFVNAAIVRRLTPAVMGMTSLRLELFYNSVMLVCRDAIRPVLLKHCGSAVERDGGRQAFGVISRYGKLALKRSFWVLIILLSVYMWAMPTEIRRLNMTLLYLAILAVFICDILLELLLEPLNLRCIVTGRLRNKTLVEMAAQFITTSFVYVVAQSLLSRPNGTAMSVGLVAFGLGQLVHSLVLTIGLLLVTPKTPSFALLDLQKQSESSEQQKLEEEEEKSAALVEQDASKLSRQILIEYVLSQGDQWIASSMLTLQSQGEYSTAVHYGALISRLLLQPVEEAAGMFFARNASDASQLVCGRYVHVLLRLDVYLLLLAAVFGPFVTRPVIGTMLGERWLNGQTSFILSWYCMQIGLQAICGSLDVFRNATMTASWSAYFQRMAVALAVVYVSLAVVLVRYIGPVGMIIANMTALMIRISAGLYYQRMVLQKAQSTISSVMPGNRLLVILILVLMVNYMSMRAFGDLHIISMHTVVIILSAAMTLSIIWRVEKEELVRQVQSLFLV